MAAVEKRKPPVLALLWNHMMFAIISIFIVIGMPFGWMKMFFGIFFFILYLFGVYDYSNRDGIEHTRSYSTIKPSYKYPIIYGLIGLSYLLIPTLAYLVFLSNENIKLFTGIFFLITNAQFMFLKSFSVIENVSILVLAIYCVIIMGFSLLGYLSGIKGFRLAAHISKYLYVKKKPGKK